MYEDFYQLSGKPFQISPDRRFFFNSAAHKRAMAYLHYGFDKGEGFIVITGGIGTGKSMLVANLLAELDQQDTLAAQLVSTQVNAEEVLQMVGEAFGLPQTQAGKAAMLAQLETYFREQRALGKRLLLVVDEAQNLPRESIEELRMLSNFQHDGHALLQSFLVGQEELRQTLLGPGMEQVRQRIIAAHHLRALDVDELRAYIEHRMALVGWKGDPQITEAAYARLHQATGGIPRRINTMADRLLLFAAIEELHRIDVDDADLVLAEMSEEVGFAPTSARVEPITSPSGSADVELADRIDALEQTVSAMRTQMQKDRMLVRKAILLQMDMEPDA